MGMGMGFPNAERKAWRRRRQSHSWLNVCRPVTGYHHPASRWVTARITALRALSAQMDQVLQPGLHLQALLHGRLLVSSMKTMMRVLLMLSWDLQLAHRASEPEIRRTRLYLPIRRQCHLRAGTATLHLVLTLYIVTLFPLHEAMRHRLFFLPLSSDP